MTGKRGPYRTHRPGSVADAILRFRQSPKFRGWSDGWRYRVNRHLDTLMLYNGREPLVSLTRGKIVMMRDQFADVPGEAANWLKSIKALLAYAVEIEFIPTNPARDVRPLPPRAPDGFRVWTEDEIDIYLSHHRPGDLARRVLILALYTGAARADLVLLGWPHLRDGVLTYRRVKTAKTAGPLIHVPVLPQLAEELARIPRTQATFLETRDGAARSPLSLTGDMARWVASAGLSDLDHMGRGLTLHGLRKALGRRLADAGCTEHEIMAVLGHRSPSSAAVYTRAYDRAAAGEAALEKMRNISPAKGTVRRLKRKPPQGVTE